MNRWPCCHIYLTIKRYKLIENFISQAKCCRLIKCLSYNQSEFDSDILDVIYLGLVEDNG